MTRRQRKVRGEHFRQLREMAGLSRDELAALMGYKDASAVRHLERGAAKPRDLIRYARAVKVPVETVLAAG